MTDRPTSAPRGLEDVLRVHGYALSLRSGSICLCGFVPEIDPASLHAQQDYHRAHVAAAIREWLTSEAVVEAAAEAMKPRHHHGAIYDAREDARAALAATAGVV